MAWTVTIAAEWGAVCAECERIDGELRIRGLGLVPRRTHRSATAAWVRQPELAALREPARASEDLGLLRRCRLEDLTAFRRRVLLVLRDVVPPGRVITYGGLAVLVDKPRGARAVAGAVARNPFPLICPCHRVVAAGARLGGFMAGDPAGPGLKRALLAAEGVAVDGERVDPGAVIG